MRGLLAGILAGLLWLQPAASVAAPVGGKVVAGSASVQQNGDVTTVTQFGNRVVLNWQSFNIGSGETVRFLQPGALAVALNRVTGVDPSIILGSLTSNGRVYLVNPNGVVFGQTATVDVGSLVVSSLADIVNEGSIKAADGGSVVLVAPLVDNEGTIVARLGQITLAGGSAQIDVCAQGLIKLDLSGKVLNQGSLNARNVELSGHSVEDEGTVDTGKTGHLLIDPCTIRIVDNACGCAGCQLTVGKLECISRSTNVCLCAARSILLKNTASCPLVLSSGASIKLKAGACGIRRCGTCATGGVQAAGSGGISVCSSGPISLVGYPLQTVAGRICIRGAQSVTTGPLTNTCSSGSIAVTSTACLRERCGLLTVLGPVHGGASVSLVDPSSLLLVSGCVSGRRVCLQGSTVILSRGGSVQGGTVAVTACQSIQDDGCIAGTSSVTLVASHGCIKGSGFASGPIGHLCAPNGNIGQACAPFGNSFCTTTTNALQVFVTNQRRPPPPPLPCRQVECLANHSIVGVIGSIQGRLASGSNAPPPIRLDDCRGGLLTGPPLRFEGCGGGPRSLLGPLQGEGPLSADFPAPMAPGGLLAAPASAAFPAVKALNDPEEGHFEVAFPAAPIQMPTSLLPDNLHGQDKRGLFRRLFGANRRRH